MKTRLLNRVLSPFLIAALVAGGVLAGVPGKADAAKRTIYNVEILNTQTEWDVKNPTESNESPCVFLASVNNGTPGPATVVANEGITFQMVVDTKANTERVKIGKKRVKATYYKVTIPRRSFRAPIAHYGQISDGELHEMEITTKMKGNAKGKLYISDGDVDVSQVMGEKKMTTKIGDGTVDPAGSLIIPIKSESTIVDKATGKKLLKMKSTTTWTTGKSSTFVKGSKSGLEGKPMPDHDPTGLLPKPLAGEPLNLDAGTGRLVSTQVSMNLKSPLGLIDHLRGLVWVMKITGTGASNPGVMKITGTGASNPGEMNPAYTVLAGMLPTPPTLPTHSVDISPIAFYATTAGTGMANVTVTSLTNEDIKGDLKVTGHYYTRTTGNVLVQWEYAGDQTVISFTGLTLHPQQTINLPVFISVGTATLPLIVVLEAEFILTGVP